MTCRHANQLTRLEPTLLGHAMVTKCATCLKVLKTRPMKVRK